LFEQIDTDSIGTLLHIEIRSLAPSELMGNNSNVGSPASLPPRVLFGCVGHEVKGTSASIEKRAIQHILENNPAGSVNLRQPSPNWRSAQKRDCHLSKGGIT
jgi:hypothetical protein